MGLRTDKILYKLNELQVREQQLVAELDDNRRHLVRRYLAHLDSSDDLDIRFPRSWCNRVLISFCLLLVVLSAFVIGWLISGRASLFLAVVAAVLLCTTTASFWIAFTARLSAKELNRHLQNTRERVTVLERDLVVAQAQDAAEEQEFQRKLDREAETAREQRWQEKRHKYLVEQRSKQGVTYALPPTGAPGLVLDVVHNYLTTGGWRPKEGAGGERASEYVRFYSGRGLQLSLTIRVALRLGPEQALLALSPRWFWGTEPDEDQKARWSAIVDDFELALKEWLPESLRIETSG